MTNAAHTRSVRRNLATLVRYAETNADFTTRHDPDLREALREALHVAAKLRMSGPRTIAIMLIGFVRPVVAMRQVERFLAKVEA